MAQSKTSFTVDSLDGIPTDTIIAVLVQRAGGSVTIGLDNEMSDREGIADRTLVLDIDFDNDVLTISMKD